MSEGISTAAVIGAGVMGSAIAAHFAGAGIRTHLLDIVPAGPAAAANETERRAAIASPTRRSRRRSKTKPAPFYCPDVARLITTGNLDDHLERLRECDLVIEAIVENLDIKKQLFEKIAPHLRAARHPRLEHQRALASRA